MTKMLNTLFKWVQCNNIVYKSHRMCNKIDISGYWSEKSWSIIVYHGNKINMYFFSELYF